MFGTIILYSIPGHKEFRFIYPIFPIIIAYASFGLKECAHSIKPYLILFLLLFNVPMSYYFTQIHQRGVIDVADYLRHEIQSSRVNGVLFLMPCHSTPYQSRIHGTPHIPLNFLTCEPPLK